jgi:hypothetical protein
MTANSQRLTKHHSSTHIDTIKNSNKLKTSNKHRQLNEYSSAVAVENALTKHKGFKRS